MNRYAIKNVNINLYIILYYCNHVGKSVNAVANWSAMLISISLLFFLLFSTYVFILSRCYIVYFMIPQSFYLLITSTNHFLSMRLVQLVNNIKVSSEKYHQKVSSRYYLVSSEYFWKVSLSYVFNYTLKKYLAVAQHWINIRARNDVTNFVLHYITCCCVCVYSPRQDALSDRQSKPLDDEKVPSISTTMQRKPGERRTHQL